LKNARSEHTVHHQIEKMYAIIIGGISDDINVKSCEYLDIINMKIQHFGMLQIARKAVGTLMAKK
jgi:hypothetical protein